MTTPQPALVLDQVTRVHHDGPNKILALDHVDLTVEYGELVAIMGPSGAGKSTLLNVAGTLDTPTEGRVLIDGIDVSEFKAPMRAKIRREHVGIVFQDFNLIPTLTVAENVALPLELGNIPRGQARTHAVEALQEIGLTEIADRYPSEVSGGQRQRAAIARALVGERRLILADEPTGALDTTTGESVLQLLRTQVDMGAAGLLVTV